MKYRKVLSISMVVAMMLGVVGCGSSINTNNEQSSNEQPSSSTEGTAEASEDNNSSEQVTLRMAWWGSQARNDATVEIINMYEEQNPNVKIEYEFYDFDGYFTKLNTLVVANDVWDIFQLGGNFPTYLDKLYPIDEFVADGTIDTSDTTDAYLKITQHEGKQLALSSGVNSYGIAYDPALFAQAGVVEPNSNWTWEDWEKACLTIHEKLGIYGSSKMDDFISGCSMAVPQNGIDLSYFNTTLDGMGFDDYKLIQPWFEMRKTLVDAGAYPDPAAVAEISDIEGDYLVTGEAAMTWIASNQFATLANAAGREIKLINPPRVSADGPEGVVSQSSQMLCISQDSEQKQEAAKFIDFFINNVEANKILNAERGTPIMKKVREAVAAQADDNVKIAFEYLDLVGSFEVSDEFTVLSPSSQEEIKDYHTGCIEKVLYGEMTPEEAAKATYDFSVEQLK